MPGNCLICGWVLKLVKGGKLVARPIQGRTHYYVVGKEVWHFRSLHHCGSTMLFWGRFEKLEGAQADKIRRMGER